MRGGSGGAGRGLAFKGEGCVWKEWRRMNIKDV